MPRWMATLLLLAPLAAGAAPEFYAIGAVGQNTLADFRQNVDDGRFNRLEADDQSVGWRAGGGIRFLPYLAAEIAYVSLGTYRAEGNSAGGGFWPPGNLALDYAVTGAELSAIGIAPVSEKFSVFARIGALAWDAELKARTSGGTQTVTDDGGDALFAVGGMFQPVRRWGFRAEYARYSVDDDDIAALSVSVLLRLGRIPRS